MRTNAWARRSGAAVAAVLIAASCADPPAPALDHLRLLEPGTAATLGPHTRIATGPTGEVLFTETFTAEDARPAFARLPASLAGLDEVLLNLRYWDHPRHVPLPGVRVAQRSVLAPVDRSGPAPRVRLDLQLGELDAAARVQVQAIAFAPERDVVRRRSLTLPDHAVLEFGYGLREEVWGPDGAKVRFAVELVDASGRRHPLFERELDPTQSGDRLWFDERVDLGDRAGQPVSLEFETRAIGQGPTLPAWSDPVVYRADATDERPNVIVISLDTLRARSLGLYGYERDTSPFIDRLAAEGAWFADAITTSVTTAPSHMSLFTGLYPVRHGIRRGNEHKRAQVQTLSQAFRRANYETAAFTENGYLLRPRGFGAGFGEYTENQGHAQHTTDARVTFAQASEWILANRRQPFFLFVHTYEVHTPYEPDTEYATLFEGDGLTGPADPDIRRQRDDYDREIRAVDHQLRGLIDTIASIDSRRSRLVVVLADHGEEFHEHGQLQHGGNVFDEALRIPLVFWSPGTIPAGRRIDGPVSLIDVAPTLLDLAGLPIPGGLDGRSLRGALLEGTPLPSRQLIAEAFSPRRWVDIWKFETWNPPLYAVRSENTKFIVHRPVEGESLAMQQFDLESDPLENEPMQVDAAQQAEVQGIVDRYLRGGRVPAAAATPSEALSPDERDRLRALGYGE